MLYADAAGKDRVPLTVLIRVSAAKQRINTTVRPREVKLPDKIGWTATSKDAHSTLCEQTFEDISREFLPRFRQALGSGDIDCADKTWNRLCEAFVIRMCGVAGDMRKEAPPRGAPLPLISVPAAAKWSDSCQDAVRK